jgi:hypothetical protein
MEEELEDSEIQLLSQKAARVSCFYCKTCIENRPVARFLVEVSVGTFMVLHFWASFLMFLCRFYGVVKVKYSLAVLPLVFLVFEVLVTCFVVFCLIFHDLCSKKAKGITLWQRQAIGRLIRNLIFYSFVEWALIMLYLRVDKKDFRLFPCIFPLILLNITAIFRYLLIKSDYSFFWLCSSLSLLSQQILLIIKLDYSPKITWETVLLPSYIQSLLILTVSIYNLFIFRDDFQNLMLIVVTCSGFCLIICGVGLQLALGLHSYSTVLTFSGLGLGSLGAVHSLGSFMVEISVGHVDSDVSELKNPIQTILNSPHSV